MAANLRNTNSMRRAKKMIEKKERAERRKRRFLCADTLDLELPNYTADFKCLVSEITYQGFLQDLDTFNGPVLDPAQAATAWQQVLEKKCLEDATK